MDIIRHVKPPLITICSSELYTKYLKIDQEGGDNSENMKVAIESITKKYDD
jgi:hypothetical protein